MVFVIKVFPPLERILSISANFFFSLQNLLVIELIAWIIGSGFRFE